MIATEPETLDPRHSTDVMGLRVTRLVHAGLSRLDPDTLEPIPYAARSWSWEDARTLVVELGDARFHSGKPLEPADVIATVEAVRSKEVGSRHARIVEPIESVEEASARRVRFRLKRPHATLLSDLEMPILRADEARSKPRPSGDLDGLGPYAIARTERGFVSLVPAEGGVLPKPARALTIRAVRDENARALRLVGKRTDAAINAISPLLLPALERDLSVRSRPGAGVTYVVVRANAGPLADKRAREALALAIDRETIARSFFSGRARAASTMLPPGHWAHVEAPAIPFDTGRARALLAGRRPRIEWLTTPDRLRSQIARYTAQTLEDAGFEVELVPLERGALIARLNAGDFDCASLQLPELGEPNVLRVFLHSTMAPPHGANRGKIDDPRVDGALDEGDATTDREARRAAYAKLEATLAEERYLIPVLHEDQIVVASPRAASFLPSADGRWLGLAQLP